MSENVIALATRQRFYFTFGAAHQFANRFVVIEGTWDSAREEMFRCFGREWGFQYDEAGWVRDGVTQEERYGLEELPSTPVFARRAETGEDAS
jgi:hypothetical protein